MDDWNRQLSVFNGESPPLSLPTIFFYSSPIIFVCNWVPLPYPILANSISSNYSVLVHCKVPANNLKCAGGGCSELPALLPPFACTLWWQPDVTALTPRTMETMTGGQGCTSASSIYHPDDCYCFVGFFLLFPFLLFFKERQGKSLHTLYFRLVRNTHEIQEDKVLLRNRATSPPAPIHFASPLNN